MQIMVEGLALAAFGMMHFMNPHERLLQQITGYVMRDEARHVAFGVLSLEAVYREMTPSELREREDFVIGVPHAGSPAHARGLGAARLRPRGVGQVVDRDALHAGLPPAPVLEDRPGPEAAWPPHPAGPRGVREDRGAAVRGHARLDAGGEGDVAAPARGALPPARSHRIMIVVVGPVSGRPGARRVTASPRLPRQSRRSPERKALRPAPPRPFGDGSAGPEAPRAVLALKGAPAYEDEA